MKLRYLTLSIVAAATLTFSLSAAVIDIHGTGEGLATGESDPNWTVALVDGPFLGAAVSAVDPGLAWVTPNPPYTWISTIPSGSIPGGVYIYTTTFTIAPGFDPSTAQISGNWWSDEDNFPNVIHLNGVEVSTFDGAHWDDPIAANAFFSVDTGFVSGANTLSFFVENTAGPGGMLIENLTGTVRPFAGVPDGGATVVLLGLSLLGLGLAGKQR